MQPRRQTQLRLVATGLVLLFAFTAVFVAAFDDPEPHALDIGLVGSPVMVKQARAQLDPGRFHTVSYGSPSAAMADLKSDELRGVLTLRAGEATVAVASAYGAVPAQLVKAALTSAARGSGVSATVVDARPLPSHDSRGLSSFFTVTGAAIASLAFAVLLTLAARGLRARDRFVTCLLLACCGGLTAAFTAQTVVGALSGRFLAVAGVLALLVAAVALTVHGLGQIVGPAGLGLGALLFLLVGTSSAGGGVTYQLQPGFYRSISQLLPNGAAATAVRNEVYFGGAHTLGALVVLAAWALAGSVLVARSGRLGGASA
jgi:hypothetical protein